MAKKKKRKPKAKTKLFLLTHTHSHNVEQTISFEIILSIYNCSICSNTIRHQKPLYEYF